MDFTYKSCSACVAFLQLRHHSELIGEENVLRNHRDLRELNTTSYITLKYILPLLVLNSIHLCSTINFVSHLEKPT